MVIDYTDRNPWKSMGIHICGLHSYGLYSYGLHRYRSLQELLRDDSVMSDVKDIIATSIGDLRYRMSTHMSLHMSVHMSIHMSLQMSIHTCLYTCLCICL